MRKTSKPKLVIAGSASLQKSISKWITFFEERGYQVLDYPLEIKKENFLEEYPKVHKTFFENLMKTDVLFVMNEDRKGIKGYIGAETFAELGFANILNVLGKAKIRIILLKMPSNEVQSYDEIALWLNLGWIELFDDDSN